MFCNKCGAEIKEGEKFCSNCGKAIKENKTKDKKINKRLIIVMVSIAIIIGIIYFLVIKNNSKQTSTSSNNIETIQEEELKQCVENNYLKYSHTNSLVVDKIEKYEDNGKGKYVYVLYSHDSSGDEEPFITFIDTSTGSPIIEKSYATAEDIDYSIERNKNDVGWNNEGTRRYYDDETLKILALEKWFEEDEYIKYQYENTIPSVWDGSITKNSDGTVTVELVLYEKETYETARQYGIPVGGTIWAEKTIKLSNKEATK